LFDFSRTVAEDMSNYDESSSCEPFLHSHAQSHRQIKLTLATPRSPAKGPVLFDEFVAFCKSRK
jgi:hypothetical protein